MTIVKQAGDFWKIWCIWNKQRLFVKMSRSSSCQWSVLSVWKAKWDSWEEKRAEKWKKVYMGNPWDQNTSVSKWIICIQTDYFVLVSHL